MPTIERLMCPRCGLKVRARRPSARAEPCARCIAQSSGALSIPLLPQATAGATAARGGPQELIARLAQGVRARVSR
jgi:hypothetical protein